MKPEVVRVNARNREKLLVVGRNGFFNKFYDSASLVVPFCTVKSFFIVPFLYVFVFNLCKPSLFIIPFLMTVIEFSVCRLSVRMILVFFACSSKDRKHYGKKKER